MTEPTEHTIPLDAKHTAVRSGNRWAVMQRKPDGTLDAIGAWSGGRRSLFQFLEKHGIAPSRAAEAALERLPEQDGFKDRG